MSDLKEAPVRSKWSRFFNWIYIPLLHVFGVAFWGSLVMWNQICVLLEISVGKLIGFFGGGLALAFVVFWISVQLKAFLAIIWILTYPIWAPIKLVYRLVGWVRRLTAATNRFLSSGSGMIVLSLLTFAAATTSFVSPTTWKTTIGIGIIVLCLVPIYNILRLLQWVTEPLGFLLNFTKMAMADSYLNSVTSILKKKPTSENLASKAREAIQTQYKITVFATEALIRLKSSYTSLVFLLFLARFALCFLTSVFCFGTAYWALHRLATTNFPAMSHPTDAYFLALSAFFGYGTLDAGDVSTKLLVAVQLLSVIALIVITMAAFQMISMESAHATWTTTEQLLNEYRSELEHLALSTGVDQGFFAEASAEPILFLDRFSRWRRRKSVPHRWELQWLPGGVSFIGDGGKAENVHLGAALQPLTFEQKAEHSSLCCSFYLPHGYTFSCSSYALAGEINLGSLKINGSAVPVDEVTNNANLKAIQEFLVQGQNMMEVELAGPSESEVVALMTLQLNTK